MKYLKDKFGRQIDHWEMYQRLGFDPKRNIPKDHESFHEIEGCQIHVLPSRGGSKHRIFYACTCDRLVPFGRIVQHLKGREHKLTFEVKAGRP